MVFVHNHNRTLRAEIHSVVRKMSGWGCFPVETCHVYEPERSAAVASILTWGAEPSYIAQGLGRSYGDAALNRDSGVISTVRLNRYFSLDPEAGVVECEAGVSLAEILRQCLPHGYFLPVTPGTKFVTVGGAIASDVHGKNHHKDGTISNFLLDFRLLAASGEILLCSPSLNSEIFWGTVGGMGLTGIILSARIRMRRVETAYVLVDYEKTAGLEEATSLMRASDHEYQYSVAWVDCLSRGKSQGRAVLMRGNHAAAGDLLAGINAFPSPAAPSRVTLPLDLASLGLNRIAVGAFNSAYFHLHRNRARRLVNFEKFFYPLDAVEHWNRLYGKSGFVQYQLALPEASGREGLAAILRKIVQSGRASYLAVLKRFGDAGPGLLSFPFRGTTLALDFPVSRGLLPLLGELDRVVVGFGGRVYLAKDAVLTSESFSAMYPKLDEFRALKHKLDPQGLWSSSLARRLGLG